MSSHHIIRENQEPALFIAEPHCLSIDYLNQLLEWSPTIITIADNYEVLNSWGIKVDVIICHSLDNLPSFLEENLQIILLEDNIWNTLFSFLESKGNYAVNILTESYHLQDLLPWIPKFNINILFDTYKTVFVKDYEKWLPKGFRLWIIDKIINPNHLENLNLIALNCYEVKEDGFVRVLDQLEYFELREEL